MSRASQIQGTYNGIFSNAQNRQVLADFTGYSEEIQIGIAKDHAYLHLKIALQKKGCWVINPEDPRVGYNMDYCLGVANWKGLLTPEMQQMAAQLNADRNHFHHHPCADVRTSGRVPGARFFLGN